jgi:hypothetical protein
VENRLRADRSECRAHIRRVQTLCRHPLSSRSRWANAGVCGEWLLLLLSGEAPRVRGDGVAGDLEAALDRFRPDEDLEDVDTFFRRAGENLRDGRIRLVSFLEEALWELNSIEDF